MTPERELLREARDELRWCSGSRQARKGSSARTLHPPFSTLLTERKPPHLRAGEGRRELLVPARRRGGQPRSVSRRHPAGDREPMKALSIRQPWAWLILHAGKDIENRGWPTSFRGRFLIHASKGMTRAEYELADDPLCDRGGPTL